MVKINREDHPELREGEIYYCNVSSPKDFRNIKLITKRLGKIAVSELGRVIKSLKGRWPRPVFVQKSELEEKGIEF